MTGVAAVGRQRLAPNLRLHKRLAVSRDDQLRTAGHHVKAGAEYNHLRFPGKGNVLPIHFGGRYIFSPIPALGVTSALDGLRRGIPAAYVQGYGNPNYDDYGYQDLSLFAQDEWKRGRLVFKPGVRYQRQFWQPYTYSVSNVGGATLHATRRRATATTSLRGSRSAMMRPPTGERRSTDRTGSCTTTSIGAVLDVGRIVNGSAAGVRTLVLAAPRAAIAWNAAGHRLTEDQAIALLGVSYPSVEIVPDPSLENSVHAPGGDWRRSPVLPESRPQRQRGLRARGQAAGNDRLQPGAVGETGRRPPPQRSAMLRQSGSHVRERRPAGHVGVGAAIHPVRRKLVQGGERGAEQAAQRSLPVPAVLHAVQDRRHVDGLSIEFHRRRTAASDAILRTRSGCRSGSSPRPSADRRRTISATASCSRASTILPRAIRDLRHPVGGVGAAVHPTGRRRSQWRWQRRRLSAGPRSARTRPTSRRASAGTAARRPRSSMWTCASASGSRSPATSPSTRSSRRSTLFNRVNFIEDTNQSSFVIFGTGAYPGNPLPTYGKYTLTMPPRQVQIAGKVSF